MWNGPHSLENITKYHRRDRNINAIFFLFFYFSIQKLNEIAKLKNQQAAGRQLELNQVEKIKKEEELTKELNGLVL